MLHGDRDNLPYISYRIFFREKLSRPENPPKQTPAYFPHETIPANFPGKITLPENPFEKTPGHQKILHLRHFPVNN